MTLAKVYEKYRGKISDENQLKVCGDKKEENHENADRREKLDRAHNIEKFEKVHSVFDPNIKNSGGLKKEGGQATTGSHRNPNKNGNTMFGKKST